MSMKRLSMKLYRPKLGVGTKSFIALSLVFWIPISLFTGVLYYLFQDIIYDEASSSMKIYLKGAKKVFEERVKITEEILSQAGNRSDLREAFSAADGTRLQEILLDLGKRNVYISMLIAADENQKVIARRSGKRGDVVSIGDTLPKALMTGEVQSSVELVSRDLLLREDEELAKLVNDVGLMQFVVSPVAVDGRIKGALIAGILITGDPWLGNTIYHEFGVEAAVFGGKPPEGAFLHATASLPRSTWIAGQTLPEGIKEDVSLGKPYYGLLDIEGTSHLVAFEPFRDSKNRIIGALGVSKPAKEYRTMVSGAMKKGIFVVAAVGLAISLIVTAFIYADVVRPLNLLSHAMEEFGKGSFDIAVDLKTGDEFERLGEGFNVMSEGVRKREDRLKKHYEIASLLMSTLDLKELLHRILKTVV